MGKQIAWNEIDNTAAEILEASDIIWDFAETAFGVTACMRHCNPCDVIAKLRRSRGNLWEASFRTIRDLRQPTARRLPRAFHALAMTA